MTDPQRPRTEAHTYLSASQKFATLCVICGERARDHTEPPAGLLNVGDVIYACHVVTDPAESIPAGWTLAAPAGLRALDVDAIENDLRELRDAKPGEMARRLVERIQRRAALEAAPRSPHADCVECPEPSHDIDHHDHHYVGGIAHVGAAPRSPEPNHKIERLNHVIDVLVSASPETPEAAPALDVERLARAMCNQGDIGIDEERQQGDLWTLHSEAARHSFRQAAREVAAEYVRLASERGAKPGG